VWCDTEWAFRQGSWREIESLAHEILSAGVGRVCITGGEPLLQPSVVPLIRHLACEQGLDVVVETGGDQDISVLPREAVRILDIKLPGSGMADRFDPCNIERLGPRDEVKLVLADRVDYEAAREWVRGPLAGFSGEILLGPVSGRLEIERLARWILEDRLPVRLQTQLHKLIWPGRERGV
jgi:7-carboxy-7-deazaguanine synthase